MATSPASLVAAGTTSGKWGVWRGKWCNKQAAERCCQVRIRTSTKLIITKNRNKFLFNKFKWWLKISILLNEALKSPLKKIYIIVGARSQKKNHIIKVIQQEILISFCHPHFFPPHSRGKCYFEINLYSFDDGTVSKLRWTSLHRFISEHLIQ